MKMTFAKLGLKAKKITTNCQLTDDITLEIRNYLPVDEKAEFISNWQADAKKYSSLIMLLMT